MKDAVKLGLRFAELEAEMHLPELPGVVSNMTLTLRVHSEEELREIVAKVGGIAKFSDSAQVSPLIAVHDYEATPTTVLYVFLDGEDFKPEPRPIPLVEKLRAEAKEAGDGGE